MLEIKKVIVLTSGKSINYLRADTKVTAITINLRYSNLKIDFLHRGSIYTETHDPNISIKRFEVVIAFVRMFQKHLFF